MTPAKLAARRIALMLNDQKWYEIERAIEEAILEGEQRGRAVDEYAPPGTVRVPVMSTVKPVYMGLGFGHPPKAVIENNDGTRPEVVGQPEFYEETR